MSKSPQNGGTGEGLAFQPFSASFMSAFGTAEMMGDEEELGLGVAASAIESLTDLDGLSKGAGEKVKKSGLGRKRFDLGDDVDEPGTTRSDRVKPRVITPLDEEENNSDTVAVVVGRELAPSSKAEVEKRSEPGGAGKERGKTTSKRSSKMKGQSTQGASAPPAGRAGSAGAGSRGVLDNLVEDSSLPNANLLPPTAAPVGNGLLPADRLTGLLEVWAFLNRFAPVFGIQAAPSIAEMERGLADPREFPQQFQQVIAAQVCLANTLLQEAFQAARDAMRVGGSSVACPAVDETCWQEGFRRYLLVSEAARTAAAYHAKTSTAPLPQKMDVPSELCTLPGRVCMAMLCGGLNSTVLGCSPLFNVPGGNMKALHCLLNRNDAEGVVAAEDWLKGSFPGDWARSWTEEEKTLKVQLQKGLRTLIHSKDSRSGAPGELQCYHGSTSAPGANSPVQWDLHRVAALAQAGAYQGEDAWRVMLSDVRSGCDIMSEAVKNGAPGLTREQKTLGVKAGNAVRRAANKIGEAGVGEVKGMDADQPFMPFEGCCVCWKDEDRTRILLCDQCEEEYHLYCLNPPLEEIPEGDWYCPVCIKKLQQEFGDGQDAAEQELHGAGVKAQDPMVTLLGRETFAAMSAEDRLDISLKLCECMLSADKLRKHLNESVNTQREANKSLSGLRGKYVSDIAAAEKGASRSVGNGGLSFESEEFQSEVLRLNQVVASACLRPHELGWDRHYNRYLVFGSSEPTIFVEKSDYTSWRYATQQGKPCDCDNGHSDPYQAIQSDPYGKRPAHPIDPDPYGKQPIGRQTTNAKWTMYTKKHEIVQLMKYLDERGRKEYSLKRALMRLCMFAEFPDEKGADSTEASHDSEKNGARRKSSRIRTVGGAGGSNGACGSNGGGGWYDPELEAQTSQIRQELLNIAENYPEEAFDPVRGSANRRAMWRDRFSDASTPQELMAGLVSLFGMIDSSHLAPHWWLWGFPTQDAAKVTTLAGVFYHLRAAKNALKRVKPPHLRKPSTEKQEVKSKSQPTGLRRSSRNAQVIRKQTDGVNGGGEQQRGVNGRKQQPDGVGDETNEIFQKQKSRSSPSQGDGSDRRRSLRKRNVAVLKEESTSGEDDKMEVEEEEETQKPRPSRKRKAQTDEEIARELHRSLNSRRTRAKRN